MLHDLSGLYWPLDWLIIFLGTYLGPILILVALSFIFRRGSFRRKFSVVSYFVISLIIAAVFLLICRLLILSPRPFQALHFIPLISQDTTQSFPSGHTIIFSALASAMWFVNRKTGYWFLLSAFLIGLGRIMAGVHWPTDIAGGLILGALSAYIAYKLFPHKKYLNVADQHVDIQH